MRNRHIASYTAPLIRRGLTQGPSSKKTLLERFGGEIVIVVVIPFLGSLIALVFESGYVSHFDVPTSLIQLDLVRILKPSAWLAFAALCLIFTFAAFVDWGESKNLLVRIAGRVGVVWIFPAVCFIGVATTANTVWVLVGLYLLGFVFATAPPLFERKTGLSYAQRLERSLKWKLLESALPASKTKSVTNVVMERVIGPAFCLLIFLLMLSIRGRTAAEDQHQFQVLDDQPDMVLVAQYGDLLIFKRVDLIRNEVMTSMELRKLGESASQVKLTLKTMGPFKSSYQLKQERKAAEEAEARARLWQQLGLTHLF